MRHPSPVLVDPFGRAISYLRLSVTDRCDLRCTYCMPAEFDGYETPDNWLQFDEIVRLSRIFVGLGVSRIRLTGGEPLMRSRITDLVGQIAELPGLRDLSLSTNGTQLRKHATVLKERGVRRLNVSLDTLNRETFLKLTGRDSLDEVLSGLSAARLAGFDPIKINMVWLPQINQDEVEAMIEFCMARGFILRLIENMPMGQAAQSLGSASLQPLIDRLRNRFGLIDHDIPGGGPARYLTTRDLSFSIGFITPISQHFCETCNRVRISVSGTLHLCLGQDDQIELLPLMRSGKNDEFIAQVIRDAVMRKPEKHEFQDKPGKIIRIMATTGG